MTIVLTGSSGFLGGTLKRRWIAAGADLVCVTRDEVQRDFAPDGGARRVSRHDGTAEAIAAALGPMDGVVVHTAAFNSPLDATRDAEALIDGNLRFGYSLLEAARAVGLSGFLNIGSLWQFGPDGENSPVNAYAAMKIAFQVLLDYAAVAHGVRSISLVISDTYAETDRRPKLLNILRAAARSGTRLEMTSGTQQIAPIHVDDIASAIETAIDRLGAAAAGSARHETFFATGAEALTIRGLVERIEAVTGLPIDAAWGVKAPLRRLPERLYLDGPALPGWQPAVTLEDGLRRVFADPGA